MAIETTPIQAAVQSAQARFQLSNYGKADTYLRGTIAQVNFPWFSIFHPSDQKDFTCIESSMHVTSELQSRGIRDVRRVHFQMPAVSTSGQEETSFSIDHEVVILPQHNTIVGLTPWDQLLGFYPYRQLQPDDPLLYPPNQGGAVIRGSISTDIHERANIANLFKDGALYFAHFGFRPLFDGHKFAMHLTVSIYRHHPEVAYTIISSNGLVLSTQFDLVQHTPLAHPNLARFLHVLKNAPEYQCAYEDGLSPLDRQNCWALLNQAWPIARSFLTRFYQQRSQFHFV